MAITPRQMLVPEHKWGIKCPYPMTAEFIVVHNTANNASANNEVSYMRNNNNQVSYHFAIDDKEVVQGIRLDRNAWHAGDGGNGRGNRKGIGIEICYSTGDLTKFKNAEKLAAKFIAQLLKERNWGVSKVTKHQDYSSKYCPHKTLDLGWGRFVDMVQSELNALNKPKIEWTDIKKTTYTTIGDAHLINLDNGQIVRNYGIGVLMDFAQKCTYNGKVYYRTDYSRDKKINNGVSDQEVAVYAPPKPEEKKIEWTKIEDGDTTKVALRDCVVINLKTGAIVKKIELGEVVKNLYDSTMLDGEVYYRTKYSHDKKQDYGISEHQLSDYVEPKDPDTPTEPEVPIERPDEPLDDGSKEVNAIVKMLEAVIFAIKELFAKLIKKG